MVLRESNFSWEKNSEFCMNICDNMKVVTAANNAALPSEGTD